MVVPGRCREAGDIRGHSTCRADSIDRSLVEAIAAGTQGAGTGGKSMFVFFGGPGDNAGVPIVTGIS